MSMRARKTGEYETDKARIQGQHKDTMASMFDKRGDTGAQKRAELTQTLDENKKGYDR